MQLLINDDKYAREFALTKMVVNMSYLTIRKIVTKEFLVKNVTNKMLNTAFPKYKQEYLKGIYKRLKGE